MLNQKSGTIKKVMVIVLVLLTVPVVHALAGSGPGGLGVDAGAPIDGGLSLLVAAGVGYGVKKARAARNKTKGTTEATANKATV